MSEYEVVRYPRAKLLAIAEDLIDEYQPGADLAEEIRSVARESQYISAEWSVDMELGSCGCLIGTVRKRWHMNPDPTLSMLDGVQAGIGIAFFKTLEMEREDGGFAGLAPEVPTASLVLALVG